MTLSLFPKTKRFHIPLKHKLILFDCHSWVRLSGTADDVQEVKFLWQFYYQWRKSLDSVIFKVISLFLINNSATKTSWRGSSLLWASASPESAWGKEGTECVCVKQKQLYESLKVQNVLKAWSTKKLGCFMNHKTEYNSWKQYIECYYLISIIVFVNKCDARKTFPTSLVWSN